MNPRLIEISRTRYTWHNATSNVVCNPIRFFYPESAEDVQAIISEAESQGLRVRAVGSGHSFSDVAKGKDFLLDMKNMRQVEKYESVVKEGYHKQNFVLADAGITVMRINRVLDEMKLALSNMGAVDFQTLSGALMTGTHGTGIKQPAFPDMMRGLRMVTTGGELLQIEPADGITNREKHEKATSIKLIQDDDIFYSTILSFGGMGIVTQLIVEVVPRFWIKEYRYLQNWSDLRMELMDGTFMNKVEANDFVALRVNPHKVKGDRLCSIVVQNIVKPTPEEGLMSAGRRNIFAGIASSRESLIEGTLKLIHRKPEKIVNRIQTSLKFSRVKNYMDKSHKVFYQFGAALLRYGISSEFAFDANAGKIIEALEAIFDQTKYMVAHANVYHPTHIPVRFVMPSKVYLSSAYKRPTVYIDVPTLYSSLADFEMLERYQKRLMKLGGVPHWGKMNHELYRNNEFLKDHFPKLQTWVEVRNQLDPKGTFLSDFIVDMGLGA